MIEVVVVPYNPEWPKLFEAEMKVVASVFGSELVRSHHIGSTSIPEMCAKPVIDILLEVADLNRVDRLASKMISVGYEVKGEFGIPGRRYYRKDVQGVRKFQIHTFQVGSAEIRRHLAFRDHLLNHPDDASIYKSLKMRLAAEFPNSMEGYIEGKSSFIRKIVLLASANQEASTP